MGGGDFGGGRIGGNLQASAAERISADAKFVLAYHNLMVGHRDLAKEQLTDVVKAVPQDQIAARLLQSLGGQVPQTNPPQQGNTPPPKGGNQPDQPTPAPQPNPAAQSNPPANVNPPANPQPAVK